MKKSTLASSDLEDLLLSLRRRILESIRKDTLKHDLTFSQIEILRCVGIEGKKTMKTISDYLKVSPPTATVLVQHMEEKGLVVRTNDKNDRRVVYISLSPKTKKTFQTMSKQKESIFSNMIKRLSPKDQEHLSRIIKILIAE